MYAMLMKKVLKKEINILKSFIKSMEKKIHLLFQQILKLKLINLKMKKKRKNYMKMINMKITGLNSLIKKGYDLLSLQTFFTSGPEETRAWTIKKIVLPQKLLVKFILILKKVL